MAKHKGDQGGRPRVKIDLAELEKLCLLQCTLPEIAAFFEVSLSSIERRTKADEKFREMMDRGYQKGKISVRRKQMQLAEAGNATMCIWLGKQLLGQRDNLDSKLTGSGPGGEIEVSDVSPTEILRRRIARIAERVAKGRSLPGSDA